jgi:isocitrate dehydrogenase
MTNVPITVAHGDGIGPEIMDATLHILKKQARGSILKRLKSARKFIIRATPPESRSNRGNLCEERKFFSKLRLRLRRAAALNR